MTGSMGHGEALRLHCREYGRYREGRPSLLLLHGLLGSSVNWHTIARRLEGEYHLLVPDLRNHGRSPHHAECGYPAMADDLVRLLDDHGLEQVIPVGHSMGGKAAMWLALHHPEEVARLVVVDVAPAAYPNRFAPIFRALGKLELERLADREEARRRLGRDLGEPALREYLLQNLVYEGGGWRWRMNLSALSRGIDRIVGFPDIAEWVQYPGEVLFLHGGNSGYLRPEHQGTIRRLFPFARLRMISGAGHWVYAERPGPFLDGLSPFLSPAV